MRYKRGWIVAGVVTVVLAGMAPRAAHAQSAHAKKRSAAPTGPINDYTSPHFVVHTDISAAEAKDLLGRMEVELGLISKYWGRPLSGIIECYVIKDLKNWTLEKLEADGVEQVRAGGGVTISRKLTRGEKFLAKATVYAVADRGTPQHEMVHAYCHQTFGRVGPTWYAEGMAEMGHYWRENDRSVGASTVVIKYLRESPAKPLSEVLSPFQVTGDSWQNYAWRWALCHLLANNPNYSPQFRPLGLGLLMGEDVNYERVYGPMANELQFEYHFFLKHLAPGLRVDLCAIDWHKKFLPLATPSRVVMANLVAQHGWQPSGLTVTKDSQYTYTAAGTWKAGREGKAVSADGNPDGSGRLVGAVMTNFQLGDELELGTSGTLKAPADGNLYLRCRSKWAALAENSGRISVKFQFKGKPE